MSTNDKLTFASNLFFFEGKKFSGFVLESYSNGKAKKQFSIFEGMMHGAYSSYFDNGKIWEIRMYKNNFSHGIHSVFWEATGNKKQEYNYFEDKMEGQQKKWYPSGKQYLFLNYTNDHEDGLQKGWRENGKLFFNYEVKNGFRYGLQKSALCFSLRDEKIEVNN